MAKTAVALVTPAMLQWGRQSARLTVDDAANRLHVKAERINSWEAGAEAPTIAQLRELAKLYKRPLGAFYLESPPKDFSIPKDYRKLPDEKGRPLSPQLALEIRRASEQREAALELLELNDEEPRPFKVPLTSRTYEEVAEAARTFLGVTFAHQAQWRDPYSAFNGWRDAVESRGVMVLQASRIDVREMRGMALHFDHVPVILLNRADLPRGRLFSLLHEFAHLALGAEGLCDAHDGNATDPEVFCNHVAAAMLMPPGPFMEHDLVRKEPNYSERWDDTSLRRLSTAFGASEEAVLRRLLTLHKTTEHHYRKMRQRYVQRYEELAAKQRDEEVVVPQASKKAGELGPLYVRWVLGALDRQAINLNEASAYLDSKIRHLPAIREVVGAST